MFNEYVDKSNRYLTNSLSKARLLAQFAHAGQVDKAGKPYFLHVENVSITVGDLISSWEQSSSDFYLQARIVGYLHDITEGDLARKEKYQKALAFLSEFTCKRCGQKLPLSAMGEKFSRDGKIFCQDRMNKFWLAYDV